MSIEKDEDSKYQKFEYENEVLDFLQSIDGTKNDSNVLSFLDNKRIKEGKLCRHMVMVMPYCASCDAMEKLINDNTAALKNLSNYEIINISGLNSQYTKIQEVKSKIANCESEDKKTITLTVNRMLTGCTVPQWDTMIFLKDTASPQDYDQAIFRLQSQYVVEYEGKEIVEGKEVKKIIKKDMKPQTLLVDFNPQRMFYLQETKSRINNINTADGGNDESEERIKRDLNVSPIIHIAENKLVEVKPTDILKAVSEYSTNRGITEAANDIIVDENLINFENVKKVIDKEFEIGSGKGFAEQAYSDVETELDDDDIHTSEKTDETPDDNHETKQDANTNTGDTQEKENDVKVFVKKCRSYYRRILFYAFLSKGEKEIKNLNDVIESLSDSENERIFNNLGMNKDFVGFLKSNMSGAALRSLDNKIYDLYRLSHEYESSDDDPIRRATTAIQRFGKISDSEVVTPQRIAKEMVSLIPEEDFKKIFENGNKFLDIASKMGEFAVAIYNRAESLGIPKESIKNSIYSIPTSNIAYEFTRFVYKKLDLSEENLAERFNSYDLLNFTNENGNVDYDSIGKFLKQNKPFNNIKPHDEITEGDDIVNFDVVVGNPPYQKMDGGNAASSLPIYHHFTNVTKKISNKFITMIMPARWLSGGRGLDDFRYEMLHDTRMAVLHDFTSASDCFESVEIKGGICYYLWNSSHNSECDVYSHSNGTIEYGKRYLANENAGTFIRSQAQAGILLKIRALKEESIYSFINAGRYFGFHTKVEWFDDNNGTLQTANGKGSYPIKRVETNDFNIKVYVHGGTCYIQRNNVVRHSDDIDVYKVLLPRSGSPNSTIIGKPRLSEPGSCSSNSFSVAVPVGGFKSKLEAENFIKYCKTRFFRMLVATKSYTQMLSPDAYEFVPVQDFSKEWTDADLYAKYGLTEEEIAFIETMIKPME